MLKPCENKQSLMSLLHAAGFYPQHAKSKYCIIFQGTNLLQALGPRGWAQIRLSILKFLDFEIDYHL